MVDERTALHIAAQAAGAGRGPEPADHRHGVWSTAGRQGTVERAAHRRGGGETQAGAEGGPGSEFINCTVAKLLNKLMIEQTKSRPRHSNDNGLAEATAPV